VLSFKKEALATWKFQAPSLNDPLHLKWNEVFGKLEVFSRELWQ
jgi:hypothetical protein